MLISHQFPASSLIKSPTIYEKLTPLYNFIKSVIEVSDLHVSVRCLPWIALTILEGAESPLTVSPTFTMNLLAYGSL